MVKEGGYVHIGTKDLFGSGSENCFYLWKTKEMKMTLKKKNMFLNTFSKLLTFPEKRVKKCQNVVLYF